MDLQIHISKNADAWNRVKAEIEETIENALSQFDQLKDLTVHVDVTLTDDQEMQAINRDHRGKDKPTNVLSFPQYNAMAEIEGQDEILLGDIVLSYSTIETEALDQGKTFEDHLAHLLVHGSLHLLGFDHKDVQDADEMEAIEIMTLAKMGIENPYGQDEAS